MSTPSRPISHQSARLRRFAGRLRGHASFEETRARREHDKALASDYRIASEHHVQANRRIELGRDGCRFCD